MTDEGEYQASDSLLPGRGYTPDYGINQSVSPSNSSEAAEIMPRPSSINSVMRSAGNSERVRVWPWREAMCSLIACLASLVNGMMLGFSSPALTQLQFSISAEDRIDPSNIKYSLFGALGPIGAMFGSLVAYPISNRVGRKPALMLSGVPALIGWLMIALAHFASSREQAFYGILLTGRMLTGFSSGWSISCVSVYILEIASAERKGRFGNCNQLFITIGILLSYLFGIEYKRGDKYVSVLQYWEIAFIAAGFVAIFEVLMLFTSETPRWLLSKHRDESAIHVLKIMRGPNFSNELKKIKKSVQQTNLVKEQLMEFRHRSVITPFLLVIMLMFFQQFSGINVAIFYASHVFLEAGLTQRQVNLIVAVAIGVVQVIATLVSVALVDCFGRKVLLTVSSIGMFLCSLVLGIYFYIYNSMCASCLVGDSACNLTIVHDTVHQHFPCNTTKFGYLAIVCIIIFIISFSLGWGPIPWTSMSELMPNRVRTLAGSIATFTNWSFATIITLCFKYYSRPPINNDGAWWTFSFIMFVAIFMVILFLPETKDPSLEEIQKYFEQGHIFAVSCLRQRSVTPPPSTTDSSTEEQ